ncbi:MAG: WbqC family protein [Candidatus Omnitrophica bacterium]|nr:WbqC family protein [Candidatus Omnitrophota bacterium]
MILSAHQPNYLPYAGFFHKIANCDTFAIWDTVQFVKRGTFGWIHRNRIKTHNGCIWLTVPILSKGKYKQLIIDTYVNNDIPWQKKHWRSIYLNYSKAPYFNKYSDFFEEFYKKKWDKLADLSEVIIRYIVDILAIRTKIVKCSNFKLNSHGTDLIIDVCKKIGADTFLSGKHGKDYLDEEKFNENNIKLIYQNFKHPCYKQLFEPFIENMSIIDLLFNEGENSINILLDAGK